MNAPSTTTTANASTAKPGPQPGVLIVVARQFLRLELARLERRISFSCFDPELSARIDRVRVALEALR